jgi:hypothetical protein
MGRRWYLSHFDHPGSVQGEKSPTYLYCRQCHQKMARLVPRAKLVIILRDPVDRAYSNWNMRYNDKRLILQGLDFNKNHANALKSLDFDQLADFYLEHNGGYGGYEKPLDIFHRGLYIEQIESLLKYFPRRQIHIMIFERLIKNRGDYLDRLYRFLGVSPIKEKTLVRLKPGNYCRPPADEAREKLYRLYNPYNERLYDFLGFRIGEWGPPHGN